jgi:hypothetical protein
MAEKGKLFFDTIEAEMSVIQRKEKKVKVIK